MQRHHELFGPPAAGEQQGGAGALALPQGPEGGAVMSFDWRAWLAQHVAAGAPAPGQQELLHAGGGGPDHQPVAAASAPHAPEPGESSGSEAASPPPCSDAEIAAAGLLQLLQAAKAPPMDGQLAAPPATAQEPKPGGRSARAAPARGASKLIAAGAADEPERAAASAAAAAAVAASRSRKHYIRGSYAQEHGEGRRAHAPQAQLPCGAETFVHPLLQTLNAAAAAANTGGALGGIHPGALGDGAPYLSGGLSPADGGTASGGDGSGGAGGGGASSSAQGSSFTRVKEKNRLAQQRFRQKQKNMVVMLKSRLGELEDLAARQTRELEAVQGENLLLRRVVSDHQGMLRAALSRVQALSVVAAAAAAGGDEAALSDADSGGGGGGGEQPPQQQQPELRQLSSELRVLQEAIKGLELRAAVVTTKEPPVLHQHQSRAPFAAQAEALPLGVALPAAAAASSPSGLAAATAAAATSAAVASLMGAAPLPEARAMPMAVPHGGPAAGLPGAAPAAAGNLGDLALLLSALHGHDAAAAAAAPALGGAGSSPADDDPGALAALVAHLRRTTTPGSQPPADPLAQQPKRSREDEEEALQGHLAAAPGGDLWGHAAPVRTPKRPRADTAGAGVGTAMLARSPQLLPPQWQQQQQQEIDSADGAAAAAATAVAVMAAAAAQAPTLQQQRQQQRQQQQQLDHVQEQQQQEGGGLAAATQQQQQQQQPGIYETMLQVLQQVAAQTGIDAGAQPCEAVAAPPPAAAGAQGGGGAAAPQQPDIDVQSAMQQLMQWCVHMSRAAGGGGA